MNTFEIIWNIVGILVGLGVAALVFTVAIMMWKELLP